MSLLFMLILLLNLDGLFALIEYSFFFELLLCHLLGY
jgi:hypothetical protein